MRKCLLSVLLTLTSIYPIFAQRTTARLLLTTDETTGDSYFEDVVHTPDFKQAQLLKCAKSWISDSIKTGNSRLDYNEKDFFVSDSCVLPVDKANFFSNTTID